MKKKYTLLIYTLFIIYILLTCSACKIILFKIYGFKDLKNFDKTEYLEFVSNINKKIDCNSIISNSAEYQCIINIYKEDKELMHNFSQAIQIMYFDRNLLRSFHINCTAKGNLKNLNWNTENRFEYFMPKSAINLDSIFIKLSNYNAVYNSININNSKRYTIIIFWTLMLKNISNDAIETVINNLDNHEMRDSVDIYLINTDKYFIDKK